MGFLIHPFEERAVLQGIRATQGIFAAQQVEVPMTSRSLKVSIRHSIRPKTWIAEQP
jgi:hypothetical protein